MFKDHYGYTLTIPEMVDFMTIWHLQYIFSDVIALAGIGLKLALKLGVRNKNCYNGHVANQYLDWKNVDAIFDLLCCELETKCGS